MFAGQYAHPSYGNSLLLLLQPVVAGMRRVAEVAAGMSLVVEMARRIGYRPHHVQHARLLSVVINEGKAV